MTEAQAKQLVLDTLSLVGRYSEITPTEIDDRVVAMVTTAVASPIIWPWVWSLLQRFLADETHVLAEVGIEGCPEPTAAAEMGLDPLTIIAIVKAIAELIKLFRDR